MPSVNILPSLVRTGVPLLVGWLLSLPVVPVILGTLGLDTQAQRRVLAQILTVVVTFLYYAVVRFLEAKVNPKFGWLLGLAAQPRYATQGPDGAYDVSDLPAEQRAALYTERGDLGH